MGPAGTFDVSLLTIDEGIFEVRMPYPVMDQSFFSTLPSHHSNRASLILPILTSISAIYGCYSLAQR